MSLLQDKINLFQNTYGVTVDFAEVDKIVGKTKYLNDFLFETKDKNPNRTKYMAGLIYLLKQHIENKTAMAENTTYDLSNLNLIDFVRAYEDIMQQKHVEENGPDAPRDRLEGLASKEITQRIKTATKKYDKPLYEVWGDRILKDEMDFSDFKRMTDNEMQRIDSGNATFANKKNFATARFALEAACTECTVGWIIFHPIQFIRQKLYLNKLIAKMEDYVQHAGMLSLIDDSTVMRAAYDSIKKPSEPQAQASNEERVNMNLNRVISEPQTNVSAPVQAPAQTQEISINKNQK